MDADRDRVGADAEDPGDLLLIEIAVVVAETLEAATEGAALPRINLIFARAAMA